MQRVQRYSRELIVHCTTRPAAQNLLLEVFGHLPSTKLSKLWFEQASVDERNYLLLDRMLNSGDAADTELRKSLATISLPCYAYKDEHDRPLMDSLIQCRFKPMKSRKIVTIKGFGRPVNHHAVARSAVTRYPAKGTPVELIHKVFQTFGVGYEFEEIRVRADSNDMPSNPLHFIRPETDRTSKYKTEAFCAKNVIWAQSAPHDLLETIEASSIRDLRVVECADLDVLYRHLMASSNTHLEVYAHLNFARETELRKGEPDGLEAFLQSRSGIKKLGVAVVMGYWKPDINMMLSNHSSIEDLYLSFGEDNMSAGMLAQIRGLCPEVRRLSVRTLPFGLPYALHTFGPADWNSEIDEPDGKGFDHRFPKIASEFVKFKSLTSLVALTRQDDPDWIATGSSPGWQGPPQEFVVDS
jgi:hypothetical protein